MSEQRTLLVTGASSGIGRATCLELVRRGHVVIAAARGMPALQELRRGADTALAATSRPHPRSRSRPAQSPPPVEGQLHLLALDVRDRSSHERALTWLDDQGLAVDVVVNCAGIAVSGPVLETTPQQVQDLFATNVFGPLALTQDLARDMITRGGGRIVNVSSTAGRFVGPMSTAYCASKYALEAFSDGMRLELAALGVQVVIIEPGAVSTGFAERSITDTVIDPDGPYAALTGRLPDLVRRSQTGATTPDAVAHVVANAALTDHPRPRYVTPAAARGVVALTRLLPTRTVDAILRRASFLRSGDLRPAER